MQQNTGSILKGDAIFSYGVDVSSETLVECSFDLGTRAKSCVDLALAIGAGANYVGAALTPKGEKVAWLTNVVDGGGGSFDWFVDYGAGWNGPRTGDVGGYNDAAYVDVAFDGDEMILHAQFVAGHYPASPTYAAGVGTTNVASASAVVWSTPFAPASASDPLISTDDVVVDPATGDAHLVARTTSGAFVYYHRPHGGSWSAPLFTMPASYRARFVLTSDGTLHLIYGPKSNGLAMRSAPSSARVAGTPIDWSAITEQSIAMPAGYENIQAIYPQTSIYQSAPVEGVRVAVVGDVRENEVLFVAVDP